MNRLAILIFVSLFVSACFLYGKHTPKQDIPREATEWCNIWITNATKSDFPRVLLVGDSITHQYYGNVEQLLEGQAYCAYLTTSWSICNPAFLDQLNVVIQQYNFDIINFNNGLHGFGHSEDEYKEGLSQTIKNLKEKCPETKIIWCNSTPLKPDGKKAELNPRVDKRNKIAVQLMGQLNIPVNDLNKPMQGHSEYYKDDYHFHESAIKIQAKQVADLISQQLQNKP